MPLSARGRQQAALVAERLVSICPQRLYSSDLQRAMETADMISQRLADHVLPCEGLREWNVGTWIGKSTAKYLDHLQVLGAHPVTHVPAGGESQLQTQARMVAQMHELAGQHAGETIVCESRHGHRPPGAAYSEVGRDATPSISYWQHFGEHL